MTIRAKAFCLLAGLLFGLPAQAWEIGEFRNGMSRSEVQQALKTWNFDQTMPVGNDGLFAYDLPSNPTGRRFLFTFCNDKLVAFDQEIEPAPRVDEPISDWADGPASTDDYSVPALDDVVNFAATSTPAIDESALSMPMPQFGGTNTGLGGGVYASLSGSGFSLAPDPHALDYDDEEEDEQDYYTPEFAPLDESEMGLADWLASARDCAQLAQSSEDRSRAALYEAVSRAYDYSLAASAEEQEFAELLAASGIAMQARAPMTPVVKLVFGADYDKTRLTEYAAALNHAWRLELGRGELADFLMGAEGGLKGVVAAERRLRREESAKPAKPTSASDAGSGTLERALAA